MLGVSTNKMDTCPMLELEKQPQALRTIGLPLKRYHALSQHPNNPLACDWSQVLSYHPTIRQMTTMIASSLTLTYESYYLLHSD